jgi:para-nitrobenzyl esterase
LEKGYSIAKTTAEKLGCKPDDIKCLRAVPAKKVLKDGPGGMGMNGNMPHHDGYALTGTPLSMIKSGNYNKVPFMAGSTRDEFGKATKLIRSIYHTRPKDYEKRIKEFLKLSDQDAAQLVSLYPLSEFDNRPVEAYGRMMGVDMALACPTYQGLLAASRQETPAYYYRFDYDGMKLGKYTGAAHSMELPFIFDSFDRMPSNVFYNDKNVAPAQKLEKVMQGYWVNFAKTGNPNGGGLPDWPAFAPDARMVKIFDDDVRTEKSGIGDRCEFWEKHPMNERPSFK